MKIIFLGTGPSHGVPVIGCKCDICTSNDQKNNRWRSSILIEKKSRFLLVDTSPEFRFQALTYNINKIDTVLFTHRHADHVHGFDDLRRFNEIMGKSIPCYANEITAQSIINMYPYVFKDRVNDYTSKPKVTMNVIGKKPFEIEGTKVQPVPIYHGKEKILGYRIDDFAYLTDCSKIPQDSYSLLNNLKVLVIGALRYTYHPNHLSVDEVLPVIEKIGPKKAYLTHMTHEIEYNSLNEYLPDYIDPAYDGLTIEL
ncbi:MBL fold metallo-hydrolase [Natranaerofaba carboxydovora]|uniref:MBL fold metallo-hydrolase n=1 Tax=Natranaerofaba carboxydovora TaxID=2742683 RepID=UPI001F148C64|nr:MBL fold metallo-hydrolase [Natranaerofaba carboxydovora]UMZ75356.1 Phosphoribosyl 1,2-cyclic phosphate phosphodiesterase [Natranaerofaba carboxydovora]